MTAPRIVVRGATFALTRRTTCRKAFLAPWHPLVEQCWLYALADAQRKHGVAVHHAVRVVNHHHLTVTLREENLGDFLRDLHRDVSRCLSALLARERYDPQREIFDGREPHAMRLLDARAQARHLLYEHLNPVAAGLVERPEHMPGTVLGFGHWKNGGVKVKRPPIYFKKSRPETLWLRLTPPPLLFEAFEGDLGGLVHQMERLGEEGWRILRRVRRRPVLGAQRLRRMHPWQEPRTPPEPPGQPVPSFRIGAVGQEGRRCRVQAALETQGFRREHREARRRYLEGDHEVAFPHGTYGARRLYGAKVAEPEPQAYLCRPGPLLQEVREALAGRRGDRQRRHGLVAELKAAWSEEAPEMLGEEALDFSRRREASEGEPDEEGERPEPVEVHLSDRRPSVTGRRPRRQVTRRDRRRGRPSGRGSSDPPA